MFRKIIDSDRGSNARRKLRDLATCVLTADFEITAIIERQEIRDAPLDDAQAVLGEPQIGDDFRIEQRHRIGGDRIAETGVKFFRHGGAASHVAPLQHHHLQSGHRQIGGTDETVVPATYDNGIVHKDS